MKYCSDCGASVEPEDVHCYNCGRRLDEAGSPSGGAYDQQSSGGPYDQQRPEQPQRDSPGWSREYPERDDHVQGRRSGQHDQYAEGKQYSSSYGSQQQGQYGPPQQPQQERFTEADREYIEDGKISYSFKFPLTDEYRPLLAGSVCYFLGSLILVPLFTLYGYVFRLVEAAAYGDTIQPAFGDDYAELTKEGLLYFGLYLVYGLGAATIMIALAVAGEAVGSDALGVGGLLLTMTVFGYFAPAVMVLYPVTGSFSAALSPNHIFGFALSTKYFVSFLFYILISVALSVVYLILFVFMLFSFIGLFVFVPAASAYFMYLTGAFWGGTYYEAAQEGIVPMPGEDQAEVDTP